MIIDFTLVVIFLVSIALLWHRISQKIPELVAIPDQVIAQRLHERSAKFQLFLLHFTRFYKEGYYRVWVLKFLIKFFYRFHIILLKIDNGTLGLLKHFREKSGAVNGNGNGNYWKQLREES